MVKVCSWQILLELLPWLKHFIVWNEMNTPRSPSLVTLLMTVGLFVAWWRMSTLLAAPWSQIFPPWLEIRLSLEIICYKMCPRSGLRCQLHYWLHHWTQASDWPGISKICPLIGHWAWDSWWHWPPGLQIKSCQELAQNLNFPFLN